MSPPGDFPRFRAPQENGEILCVPTAEKLLDGIKNSRAKANHDRVKWFDSTLAELAQEARAELLADALCCTRQYSNCVAPLSTAEPIIITGHQPEIFHPGVWLKNFSASQLASQCHGTAINLIIDSDLCRSPAIRVPTGDPADPLVETVAFDRAVSEMPYEERLIVDSEVWSSFGTRTSELVKPIVANPFIDEWWPEVLSCDTQNLGAAISQARHKTEIKWGSRSLELPQSAICRGKVFRWFACYLLQNAGAFRKAYNTSLSDYRVVHRLKNHAQPVPDLAIDGDWIETPFWIWNLAEPTRRGVYVRPSANGLEISDRKNITCTISSDPERAAQQFAELETAGIKLRTRALATTLFARLFLADLFIHGIGGAKYDQVTDSLSQRFVGIELPAYATISGTLRLSIDSPATKVPSVNALRQELRDLRFHPERHLDEMNLSKVHGDVERLISRKQEWIRTLPTPANVAERHRVITNVNHELQPYLKNHALDLEKQMDSAKQIERAESIRNSREYAYCLFPSGDLREFFRV